MPAPPSPGLLGVNRGRLTSQDQVTSAVPYSGRLVGRYTQIVTPEGVVRDSSTARPVAVPWSGKRRRPAPTITGNTSRLSRSTRSLSSRNRTSAPLPCTWSSRPSRFLSFRTAAARSPSSTVVLAHCGSLRVVEATYLGSVLRRVATGVFGVGGVGQEAAKMS